MCGIAGILALGQGPISESALRSMTRALAHRGPDGEAFWIAGDRRAGLGHRRLAIIDLDARAAQPMTNEDGTIFIVFNGEIYNHPALRAELAACGHQFQSASSDTESLIHGYEQWGIEGLLQRIDGIYSFAIHDSIRRVTHLVRDAIGIKPLYVAWRGRGPEAELLFASEMRGILAHPAVDAEPSWTALRHYLTFMAVPAPETMMRGIYKIPAGHRLAVFDGGDAHLIRTFSPVAAQSPPAISFEDARVALRQKLAGAVESQMIADVPVSVMLSGGIDSSALLALASRQHGALDAFTIRFDDDPESDETEAAAMMARRCGARHHIFSLSPQMAQEGMDAVISAQDEPQADWVCLPLWFLAQDVARHGTKVILVGEGADEQFAGYGHWRRYLGDIAAYAQRARITGKMGAHAAHAGARLFQGNMRMLTRLDFLKRAAQGQDMFWGGAVLAWPMAADSLLMGDEQAVEQPRWKYDSLTPSSQFEACSSDLVRNWYADIDRQRPQQHSLDRMIALEFLHRLPELLLMRVDKMTMAHGVEARVPFLARSMVEFSMSLPAELKLSGPHSKWLLREAVRDLLPEQILSAPKKGFGAPVDRWLRGAFGPRAEDAIVAGPLRERVRLDRVKRLFSEHRGGQANHAGLIWALYVASRWISASRSGRE